MPDFAQEPHAGRRERVVFWEFQLGWEDAAFEGGALGTLDEGFPVQEVVFGDGAGGDAFGRVVGQGAVFLEQTALGGCRSHID